MVRNVAVMYCGLSAPHLNATLPSSVAFERSTGAGDLSADRGKLSVHMQYRNRRTNIKTEPERSKS